MPVLPPCTRWINDKRCGSAEHAHFAQLLLGWSLLAEGSGPHDPVRFTQLVAGLMETGLDAAPAPSEAPVDAAGKAAEASGAAAEAPAGEPADPQPGAEATASSEATSSEAAEETAANAD